MMTRREFLKKTAIVAGGVLMPVSALEILEPGAPAGDQGGRGRALGLPGRHPDAASAAGSA